MRLSQLIDGLPGITASPGRDVEIRELKMDSRQVKPGDLFVALQGGQVDAHQFIGDALSRGASAVVGQQPLAHPDFVYVQVQDSRLALVYLAAAIHGFPASRLVMIGVTGTDGKTTTANLIYHILQAAGLKAGMVSTVNARIADQVLDTGFHVTTPEAPLVQSYLAQMVAAGLTHVVLEATSHGLAQRRVAFCEFDMAVVTNITHEHLDYHGSFEAYRAAKGLLFEGLSQTKPKMIPAPRGAVLNRDDSSFDYLSWVTQIPGLNYGLSPDADVRAVEVEMSRRGTRCMVKGRDLAGENFQIRLENNLIGEFNLYNCLAAVALTRGIMRIDPEAVRLGVSRMEPIPGRMEAIDLGQDFTVLVDFAHTPNALHKSLEAARRITRGRLIAVFGSAGLRDRAKRRLMAEASLRLADRTVLTAEDPRTESLAGILQEMAEGAKAAGGLEGSNFWRVPDRREALRFALRMAQPGDLVIACGKGHEQSMCFGEIEYLWDDRQAVKAALAELLGVPGPEMPVLPDVTDSE